VDEILAHLLTLLTPLTQDDTRIARIEVGRIDEIAPRSMGADVPKIVIQGNGTKDTPGPWANHRTSRFDITFAIVHANINPTDARLQGSGKQNPYFTLEQISDRIRKTLATDKKLGGLTTTWLPKWDCNDIGATDEGSQVRIISTSWENMFVPDDGKANDQANMVRS
jgi:hypothetical protein